MLKHVEKTKKPRQTTCPKEVTKCNVSRAHLSYRFLIFSQQVFYLFLPLPFRLTFFTLFSDLTFKYRPRSLSNELLCNVTRLSKHICRESTEIADISAEPAYRKTRPPMLQLATSTCVVTRPKVQPHNICRYVYRRRKANERVRMS